MTHYFYRSNGHLFYEKCRIDSWLTAIDIWLDTSWSWDNTEAANIFSSMRVER